MSERQQLNAGTRLRGPRPQELQELDALREKDRKEWALVQAAVCDGAEWPDGFKVEDQELTYSTSLVAIPTLGGVLVEKWVMEDMRTQHRFPDEVVLPVTVEAAKGRWVVVEYKGKGVAMSVEQAYQRKLREARHWVPDLREVDCVPMVGEIEGRIGGRKND